MKKIKQNWWLVTIGILLLLSLPALYIISSRTNYTFIQLITIFNSVGSVILTFVLAILYSGLASIQTRQTRLMEKEHIPSIELDGTFALGYGPKWGPHFELNLSNTGKGNATNLRLVVDPQIVYGNEEFHIESLTHELHRYKPQDDLKIGDSVIVEKKGNYLRPQTSETDFFAQSSFGWSHDGSSRGVTYLPSFPQGIAHVLDRDLFEVDEDETEFREPETGRVAEFGNNRIPLDDIDESYLQNIDPDIDIVEEKIKKFPTEETIDERANEVINDCIVRFQATLKYDTEEGETETLDIYDRYICIISGPSFEELIRAGVPAEDIEEFEPERVIQMFKHDLVIESGRNY